MEATAADLIAHVMKLYRCGDRATDRRGSAVAGEHWRAFACSRGRDAGYPTPPAWDPCRREPLPVFHHARLQPFPDQAHDQVRPHDCPHMARGQSGSLFLPCTTLSFATPCRFIPALSRPEVRATGGRHYSGRVRGRRGWGRVCGSGERRPTGRGGRRRGRRLRVRRRGFEGEIDGLHAGVAGVAGLDADVREFVAGLDAQVVLGAGGAGVGRDFLPGVAIAAQQGCGRKRARR